MHSDHCCRVASSRCRYSWHGFLDCILMYAPSPSGSASAELASLAKGLVRSNNDSPTCLQVYEQPHEAKMSHELLGGAAAFMAMRQALAGLCTDLPLHPLQHRGLRL